MSPFESLTDIELIGILQRRGYVAHKAKDASCILNWNRTEPFPPGIDFKQEALGKIRDALTINHILFSTRETWSLSPPNVRIHTARLLLL